ncbi:MAG: GNAT family N-acetyltransferase [Planctomycetota bacterium]
MTLLPGGVDTSDTRLLALLGGVLRPESPASLAAEQPAIFGPAATGHICSIEIGGEIVAGAACTARIMITPRGRLKIGLIGSVATDPSARKQGHGAAAVEACELYLLQQGCSTVLLWADVPAFYQKRGYIFAGTEYLFLLPPLDGWTPAGIVERYQSEDLHSVEQIRQKESARSDRPRAESALHYENAGTEVYIYRPFSSDHITNRITAYAAFGRGGDLAGTVHEFGGSVSGIISILQHILQIHKLESLLIIVNAHRADLIDILESCGIERQSGVLGMVKCLDLPALANELHKKLPEGAKVEISERNAIFSYNNKTMALSETELLRAVIGDGGKREVLQSIETALGIPEIVNLPIEPGFGGFDSI